MPTVADALRFARNLGIDPRDAELLLAHRTGTARTQLLTHLERRLSVRLAHAVTTDLLARQRGTPLAYLLGFQEFYGLRFVVSPATLIPRPETEALVEEALRRIPSRAPFRVADVGTGSGCIAVALVRNRTRLRVEAIDRSPAALRVARSNVRRLRASSRVRLHRGSLLAPLRGTNLDAVVANLPYLPAGPIPRFEPAIALRGGPDGTRWFRPLFRQLRWFPNLRFAALEIDPRTVGRIRARVPAEYRTTTVRDLANRPRVLVLEQR